MSWTGRNEILEDPIERDKVEAMLEQVGARYTAKRVPKNALVFWLDEPNENHYYLAEGSVECFRVDAAGRMKVIDRYNAGSFFGFHILRDNCLPMTSARCCEDCCVLAIPKESFFKLLHGCPEFADRTVRYLFGLLSMQTREVLNSSFYATSQRVPMLLAELVRERQGDAGLREGDGDPATLPYSNVALADMLGISRNSVSTALSRLQAQGVVEKQRNSIRVLDVEKLEAIARMEQG